MLYLNGTPLSVTMFPDKTSQVWKLPEEVFAKNKHTVDWQFEHEGEIIHLLQLHDLISTTNRSSEITLNIKYLPYGRQDKPIGNSATFALNTFLKLLHLFRFHKVTVLDPHNFDAVRPGCQFEAIYPKAQLIATIIETNASMICYPDKGAKHKYTDIYKDIPVDFIYGEKVRDQLTGNITNYEVFGDPNGKSVMIVDDICDGGATFKILAKDLLAKGATEVNLFVTHGIFSRGLQTLKDAGINRIFTHEGEKS